jgi:crotonobetainyl-CoA:carnitine CoA-transferase CaiB-like acyl-CoA transferase
VGGPLQGIKVVELGFWVAGPGTAALLADWGAEVVKIEPPEGDPFRGMFLNAAGLDVVGNPPFDLDNRGKRSVGLNLQNEEGRRIADKLLERADVFVTNLRPSALRRFGLDSEEVCRRHRRLVYCNITGYGTEGQDCDRPAYDVAAFWSRSGIAASLVPHGAEPPQQRGGMGDHSAALSAVGAVCAALLARERTGEGQVVSTSLLRAGMYVLGWDLSIRLRYGRLAPPYTRFTVPNPLLNSYCAGDERWFWLVGLQGDRHWPDLVRAVSRPELLDDARFSDMRVRRENAEALVRLLDDVFATRWLAEWGSIFDREGVWWAPVQTPDEVVADEQVRAAGGVATAPVSDGEAETVAGPADFSATPWRVGGAAPEFAQHTEEVLLELGYDWGRIADLKEKGAIP